MTSTISLLKAADIAVYISLEDKIIHESQFLDTFKKEKSRLLDLIYHSIINGSLKGNLVLSNDRVDRHGYRVPIFEECYVKRNFFTLWLMERRLNPSKFDWDVLITSDLFELLMKKSKYISQQSFQNIEKSYKPLPEAPKPVPDQNMQKILEEAADKAVEKYAAKLAATAPVPPPTVKNDPTDSIDPKLLTEKVWASELAQKAAKLLQTDDKLLPHAAMMRVREVVLEKTIEQTIKKTLETLSNTPAVNTIEPPTPEAVIIPDPSVAIKNDTPDSNDPKFHQKLAYKKWEPTNLAKDKIREHTLEELSKPGCICNHVQMAKYLQYMVDSDGKFIVTELVSESKLKETVKEVFKLHAPDRIKSGGSKKIVCSIHPE